MGNVNGTADVAAVLVLVEGPTISNEEITGVQMRVAQIFVSGAMKLIAAGLRGEINHAASKTAPFSRQVICLNLEFLKRILSGNQAELVDVAVIQGHAVEVLRPLVGDGAPDLVVAIAEGVLAHGITLRLSLRYHAGRQGDQVHRVASVQRQLVHLPLRDDLAQVACRRL